MGNNLISFWYPCLLIYSQRSLFVTPERIFWAFQGYKREHWEEVGKKTIVEFRLFPLWIDKALILKKKRIPISKWHAGSCINDISNIATLFKYRLKQSWSWPYILWSSWIAFLKKQRQTLAANYFKNSVNILPLRPWCPTCALLGSDILCCCWTWYFHYCDNSCAHKTVGYTLKALKVYLCNLIRRPFS